MRGFYNFPLRNIAIGQYHMYKKKNQHKHEQNKNNPWCIGGARGVMVIVVGNGHDDSSSNPGRDWLYFT